MSQFKKDCLEVEDALGIEIIDFYADGEKEAAYEDDGVLHVTIKGERAAFDVSNNQSLSAKVQKENVKSVLMLLGMTGYL